MSGYFQKPSSHWGSTWALWYRSAESVRGEEDTTTTIYHSLPLMKPSPWIFIALHHTIINVLSFCTSLNGDFCCSRKHWPCQSCQKTASVVHWSDTVSQSIKNWQGNDTDMSAFLAFPHKLTHTNEGNLYVVPAQLLSFLLTKPSTFASVAE